MRVYSCTCGCAHASTHVCAWICVCVQLHTCMCMYTRVHAHVCTEPCTPRLPPSRAAESSSDWHMCVWPQPQQVLHVGGWTDRGAVSPGQENSRSHRKPRTLPAPCLSCCQLPADAAAAGLRGRVAAAGFSCAAGQAHGTGRVSLCSDSPKSPNTEHRRSESAGRHEAQPGAMAPQTSHRLLCWAADLSGCQDKVVFGIMALAADQAKQTSRCAEGIPGVGVLSTPRAGSFLR